MSDEDDYLDVDLNPSGATKRRLEETFEAELQNDLATVETPDIPAQKYLFEVHYYLNYIEPEPQTIMMYFDDSMPNMGEVHTKILKGDQRLFNTPSLLKIEYVKQVNPADEKVIQNIGGGIQFF